MLCSFSCHPSHHLLLLISTDILTPSLPSLLCPLGIELLIAFSCGSLSLPPAWLWLSAAMITMRQYTGGHGVYLD